MNITVILCTYNRCESLRKALDSVVASTLPASVLWEVLVIDNNSKDQTRAVVEEYSRKHPGRVSYLFEPRQGKSHALNRGINEAHGDVLAFMDDDVEVNPDWLHHLTAPLNGGEWAGSGGRILLSRSFKPARWMDLYSRHGLAPLAMFDRGLEPGELKEPPFGTNMAFSREVFSKYGGFRVDLGPQPNSEIRGEDTEFGARLLAGGERLWYEPSAVVYHSVPENRNCKSYFLLWWFDKARADIRESGVPQDTRWYLAGVPLYFFRRLVAWSLRWVCSLNPRRRFLCEVNLKWLSGLILECYCVSKSKRVENDKKEPIVAASCPPRQGAPLDDQ